MNSLEVIFCMQPCHRDSCAIKYLKVKPCTLVSMHLFACMYTVACACEYVLVVTFVNSIVCTAVSIFNCDNDH